MSETDLEKAFHAAMVSIYERAKAECKYNAARFLQMVNEQGGLRAAKTLLHSNVVSDGMVRLWECRRLDLSVEALILQPEWSDLFSEHERGIARQRLSDFGYQLLAAKATPQRDASTPRAHSRPPQPKREAIVEALLRYGESQTPKDPTVKQSFTPDPAANDFVIFDPFAFLIAVICDQGIRAETAWGIPYELRRRLGHLDPKRIVANANAVRAAFQADPAHRRQALHRYVNTVPDWVVAAAERVISHYGGNAGAIWGDKPSASELQRRLIEFVGIGQKKAAMAVEILERDLHVPIRDLVGSDIAYDIHVRRVLLRTGLAERDDPNHMIAVARAANPARPGAIDLPAWLVGRQWCHSSAPECLPCPLTSSCAKDVDRAAGVKGV